MDIATYFPQCSEDLEIPCCPFCGEPLKYRLSNGALVDCICSCEKNLEEASELAAKKAADQKVIDTLRSKAFVSKAMFSKTFENSDHKFGKEQEALALKFANYTVEHSDSHFGLLMCGSPAGGKTYHSACIANKLVDNKKSVIMRSMPRIISDYKFNDNQMLQDFEACDLLIIDDLGTERETTFGQELVYSVIDSRYCAQKPLIVSTNLTLEQLSKPQTVMEQRIYGRVLEMCYPVKYETKRTRVNKDMYADFKKAMNI